MVTILFDRARISVLLNDVLTALCWGNYGIVQFLFVQTNKKRKTSSVQMSTLFFLPPHVFFYVICLDSFKYKVDRATICS